GVPEAGTTGSADCTDKMYHTALPPAPSGRNDVQLVQDAANSLHPTGCGQGALLLMRILDLARQRRHPVVSLHRDFAGRAQPSAGELALSPLSERVIRHIILVLKHDRSPQERRSNRREDTGGRA